MENLNERFCRLLDEFDYFTSSVVVPSEFLMYLPGETESYYGCAQAQAGKRQDFFLFLASSPRLERRDICKQTRPLVDESSWGCKNNDF